MYRSCTAVVVHVDDLFAVGQRERCNELCDDLNNLISVKNIGGLQWYGGCHCLHVCTGDTLKISQ